MVDNKMATNKHAQLNIRVVRILNRVIHDPDKLEEVLKEIEEVIEKDATAPADQAQAVTS